MEHSPVPWTTRESAEDCPLPSGVAIAVHRHDMGWQITGRICTMNAQGDHGYMSGVTNGNALLIAMAPFAPHECSVPGCPGPENKQRLEAHPELLACLKNMTDATALAMRLLLKHGLVDEFIDEAMREGLPAEIGARAHALIAKVEGK